MSSVAVSANDRITESGVTWNTCNLQELMEGRKVSPAVIGRVTIPSPAGESTPFGPFPGGERVKSIKTARIDHAKLSTTSRYLKRRTGRDARGNQGLRETTPDPGEKAPAERGTGAPWQSVADE